MELFVTYSISSLKGRCFSQVSGATREECRKQIRAACADKWAFTYDAHQFAGQAEKYGLLECELGPQDEPPRYIHGGPERNTLTLRKEAP